MTADDWQVVEEWIESHLREPTADALAALARLREREAQMEERLTAYETPGWINSVQKVMEERRRAEAAEARVARLEEALREIADVTMIESNQVIGTARLQNIYGVARSALEEKT